MRRWAVLLALLVAAPAFGQSVWPAAKVDFDDGEDLQTKLDEGDLGGGLPAGGSVGQVLINDAPGSAEWDDQSALSVGSFAADPANCSAGNYPLGIAADGSVQSCTAAGAGSQSPWVGTIDADGFTLTDLGNELTMRLQPMGTAQSFHMLGAGDVGWQFGTSNPVVGFTGTASDNVFSIAYNVNPGGSGAYNPFNPIFTTTFEGNYGDSNTGGSGGSGGGTWWEWHMTPQRTESVLTVASGTSFAVGDRVTIRDASTNVALATARVAAKSSNDLTLYWFASVHNTDRPAQNDEIESESTSTLTGVSGTFNLLSRIWVSNTSSCSGLSDTTYTALLVPVAVGPPLEFYLGAGDLDAVVSGNCVQQASSGATGLLGTVTPNAASTINEVVDATDHTVTDFRWLTTAGSYQDLDVAFNIYTTKTASTNGDPAFRIAPGLTAGVTPGRVVCMNQSVACSGGAGAPSAVAMGDAGEKSDLILHGDLQIYGRTGSSNLAWIRTDGSITTPAFLWLPDLGGGGQLAGFQDTDGVLSIAVDRVPVIRTANSGNFKASPVTISDAGLVAGVTTQRVSTALGIPSGDDPASTCTTGDLFMDLDQTVDTDCATTADNTLCCCVAPNTWAACSGL